MKDHITILCSMDKANTFGQMVIPMKVNTLMARKMAKEFINGLVGQLTKVSLIREKCVDKAFIYLLIVKNIKEALRIINLMEKVSISGQVAKYLLVNIKKA